MKAAAFIIGEIVVAGLLAALLFVALLFQPTWVWIAAALIMLGAFIGIIAFSKVKPGRAWLLVLLCPLSYTLFLAALALQSPSIQLVLTVAAYYAGGVLLLGVHQLLNARAR